MAESNTRRRYLILTASEALAQVVAWLAPLATAILGGLAARANDVLADYGALAWVAVALIAGALTAGAIALVALAKLWFVRAAYLEGRIAPGHQANPAEVHFANRRIKLTDFALPWRVPISGKTFVNCELVGPTVLILRSTQVIKCAFVECDWIPIPKSATVHNGIMIADSTLRSCTLYGLTILVVDDDLAAIATGVRGANFLKTA